MAEPSDPRIGLWIDGRLAAPEIEALCAEAQQDPDLMNQMLAAWRLHRRLEVLCTSHAPAADAVMTALAEQRRRAVSRTMRATRGIARRRRFGWPLALAAAALVVVGIGLVFMAGGDDPAPGDGMAAGLELAAGSATYADGVWTAGAGGGHLRAPGVDLHLEAGARVGGSLPQLRWMGAMAVAVDPTAGLDLRFQHPAASVAVLGTRFTLQGDDEAMRVAVERGRIALQVVGADTEQEVKAGGAMWAATPERQQAVTERTNQIEAPFTAVESGPARTTALSRLLTPDRWPGIDMAWQANGTLAVELDRPRSLAVPLPDGLAVGELDLTPLRATDIAVGFADAADATRIRSQVRGLSRLQWRAVEQDPLVPAVLIVWSGRHTLRQVALGRIDALQIHLPAGRTEIPDLTLRWWPTTP